MSVRILSVTELREGMLRRALRDTAGIILTLPCALASVLTAAATTIGVVLLSESLSSPILKAVLAGAGVLAGFALVAMPAFLFATMRAPLHQRDEARRALSEHGGPKVSIVHRPDWSTSMLRGRRHQYVTVACGGTKPRKGGWPLDPTKAWAFANSAFPDTFPRDPTEYGHDVISFDIPGDGGLDDSWRRMIRFHAGGLVELTWRLPEPTMVDGAPMPSLLEICRPIFQLADAVGRGVYSELYPSRWPRRVLTWMTGINIQTVSETGSLMSNDLVFPRARPGGRARRGYLAMNGGYYDAAIDTEPVELLRSILQDQLTRSGWMDCDVAIQDTLDAVVKEFRRNQEDGKGAGFERGSISQPPVERAKSAR